MLNAAGNRTTWAYTALYAIVVLVSLPLYGDRWHLLLHILGAVVFVGNIVVSAAWMLLAERTGQTSVLRFASRTVSQADLLFTGPGVILVLGNGLALASSRWGGWTGFYVHSWIVVALGLFAASGLVWVGFLLRYQFKLVGLSAAAVESGAELTAEFSHVLRRWYAWGSVATLLPLLSLYLMVMKPEWW